MHPEMTVFSHCRKMHAQGSKEAAFTRTLHSRKNRVTADGLLGGKRQFLVLYVIYT